MLNVRKMFSLRIIAKSREFSNETRSRLRPGKNSSLASLPVHNGLKVARHAIARRCRFAPSDAFKIQLQRIDINLDTDDDYD